jgi:hypothetical protein
MQDAFARIASEAGILSTQAMLRYRLATRVHEPVVRGSWLGAPSGSPCRWAQQRAWSGMNSMCCWRQPASTLARFLLVGTGLLAGVLLIVCCMHHLPLVGAPVALALWAVVAWRWHAQARSLAFRADRLMVRWLGRGPACSGLHALAEHSQAPRRRRWGEPSLDERIERVCGTGVEARENRLTLVG